MKENSIDSFDIVDALYATAIDAEQFDTLLKTWSTALGNAEWKGVEFEVMLAGHLDKALQLLDTEAEKSSEVDLSSLQPEFVIDQHNRVSSLNDEAKKIFGRDKPRSISDLNLKATSIQRLTKAIEISRDNQPQLVVLCTTNGQNFLAEIAPYHLGESNGELSVNARQFVNSEAINDLLEKAFSLTPSEVDILGLVLSGNTPQEIATIRNRKLPTVRTQIKSLLEKTSTQSQVELIRMATGLAASMSRFENGIKQSAEPVISDGPGSVRRFLLSSPNARQIEYSEVGAPQGRPLLYFHDEFFGDAITSQFERHLCEKDLKLVCVFRPGFGGTSPAKKRIPYAEVVHSDTEAVLKELSISTPISVLARGTGFYRATILASQNTEFFDSIVGVRPSLPWINDRNVNSAPRYTRLVVKLSASSPRALEFIAKAGYKYFAKFGAEKFIKKYYVSAGSDLQLLKQRDDVLLAMETGSAHALRNGIKGTAKDLVETKVNWLQSIEALTVRTCLVIGEDDPTFRLSRAKLISASNQNIKIKLFPNSGHLVFYTDHISLTDVITNMMEKKVISVTNSDS